MLRTNLAALLILAFLTSGCGRESSRDSGDPNRSTSQGKGVIGVSVLTMTNPFFKVIGDAVAEEAGKQGYEVVVVSGDNDVPAAEPGEGFPGQEGSGDRACPCDSKAIGPAIQEANAAGMPVFTADIACLAQGVKVVTHVATDNYRAARKRARA